MLIISINSVCLLCFYAIFIISVNIDFACLFSSLLLLPLLFYRVPFWALVYLACVDLNVFVQAHVIGNPLFAAIWTGLGCFSVFVVVIIAGIHFLFPFLLDKLLCQIAVYYHHPHSHHSSHPLLPIIAIGSLPYGGQVLCICSVAQWTPSK